MDRLFEDFAKDRQFIWDKYHGFTAPAETGMPFEDIKAKMASFAEDAQTPVPILKARAVAFICANLRIDVNSQDFFPTFDCWNRADRPVRGFLSRRRELSGMGQMAHGAEWSAINASGAGNQWVDYDHSVPEWDYILPLGFPGILAKAEEARESLRKRQNGSLTPEQDAYYEGIRMTYTAFLELMGRFVDFARNAGSPRQLFVADCVDGLRRHEPKNTFEVLQFIYLYFMLSEHLDHYQVRSLGNLDNMLLPYFRRDVANGTFSEAQIRVLMDYFLMQWGGIDNYWGQPLYLGGTDEQGCSRVNEMTYIILEEHEKCDIPTPKIQIKVAENTPDAFIDFTLKRIRRGHNSIVLLSEEQMARVLMSKGFTQEDARTCKISGCYEFGATGRHASNGTGVAHLNFLKPLEWLFNGGVDTRTGKTMGHTLMPLEKIASFEEFLSCYFAHLDWIVDTEIQVANEFEAFIPAINPANVFSAAVPVAVENGKDAFFDGCYRNSSGFLGTGFASAADALEAVRELVFEKQEISLVQLGECLRANWQGYEKLHEYAMKKTLKFGNGCERVDSLAQMLVRHFADAVNGRPNSRGGSWTASGHCAKQYFQLGLKTMATPDGRYDGEEMSKNLSPVQGMDRQGLTALLKSMATLDPVDLPGDFPLDVMLHPATVQGDDGLTVWRSLLRFYLAHGVAVHFNIFDAETLKAAQREPEKYQGLQIRVCGWNVRFTTMAPVEQDMYIRRAEAISE